MNAELNTESPTASAAPEAATNQNALKAGLYTRAAYIRPGEEAAYREVIDSIFADLQPEGALEHVFASEIVNATWRLRRCGLVEGNLVGQTLIDAMEDEAFEKKQRSIDRARAAAHNIIRRSLAELRKLQTERATRRELEITHEQSVLVDSQKISRNIEAKSARDDKWRKRVQQQERDQQQQQLDHLISSGACEATLPRSGARPTAVPQDEDEAA